MFLPMKTQEYPVVLNDKKEEKKNKPRVHKQNQIEQKLLHQGVQTIKKKRGKRSKESIQGKSKARSWLPRIFSPILFKHPLSAYAQHLAEKKGNKNWDEAGTGGGGKKRPRVQRKRIEWSLKNRKEEKKNEAAGVDACLSWRTSVSVVWNSWYYVCYAVSSWSFTEKLTDDAEANDRKIEEQLWHRNGDANREMSPAPNQFISYLVNITCYLKEVFPNESFRWSLEAVSSKYRAHFENKF